ncbi:hypothetical protein I5Q34_13090 [Streptomyces sp. AV19]|uniref:WXG100 family type VII secretion target n=1 Tax=Streptomyces sp. AV19 TaxID=2793068 RepID=UPI0018FE5DBC|nr:hypothetical protein [Streptomyces sp. AV19]MBH1935198.1 hypothetical protein [Streptomyces sp. AV19]MDG4532027.1 hypothetical protein [Streptomyces sp. AV19]
MSDRKQTHQDHADGKLPEPPDVWMPLPPGQKGVVAPPPLSTLWPGQPNLYDPGAPDPQRSLPPGVHGPVAPNLRIEGSVLEGAAGKADAIHDAFQTPAASLEAPTRAAARALDGLQTADALKRSHEQWEQQAGTVTAWLTHISKSLRLAAHSYKDTDHGVRDGFRPSPSSRFPQPYPYPYPGSSPFPLPPNGGR